MKKNERLNMLEVLKRVLRSLFARTVGSWGPVGVDSKDRLRGF